MLFFLIFLFVICLVVVITGAYTVKQQTFVIIERLGKFKKIVGPGFHVKIPIVDKIANRVDMRTHQSEFNITAKTKDNVNISMKISSQYKVDDTDNVLDGVYRSYYALSDPIQQMESYLIDSLRSSVPQHTLDDVYEKKDNIASTVNASVKELMKQYGFIVVSTLITGIILPEDVEVSMNSINAAQREKAAAQSLAEAEKIKLVTEASAKAESAKLAGKGVANQRIAIAEGISSSLDMIKKTGVSTEEANKLFMFTQWIEVMDSFAKNGSSTVVLPSNFNESASMFDQIISAQKATESK